MIQFFPYFSQTCITLRTLLLMNELYALRTENFNFFFFCNFLADILFLCFLKVHLRFNRCDWFSGFVCQKVIITPKVNGTRSKRVSLLHEVHHRLKIVNWKIIFKESVFFFLFSAEFETCHDPTLYKRLTTP